MNKTVATHLSKSPVTSSERPKYFDSTKVAEEYSPKIQTKQFELKRRAYADQSLSPKKSLTKTE